MKRYISIVLCLAFAAAMSLSAAYAQQAATEKATAEKAVAEKELSGKIVSIDPKTSTLVVKNATESITVTMDAKTVICKGTKAIALANLAAGEEITVKYTVDAKKQNLASSILSK